MKFHSLAAGVLSICLAPPSLLFGQAANPGDTSGSSIHGVVADPSGALVPAAAVVLHPAAAVLHPSAPALPDRTTATSPDGRYTFTGVAPGTYTIRVAAAGFAAFESKPLRIASGRSQTLDVRLQLQTQQFQVDVSSDAADQTDPNKNGDAIVLKGKDLDALPTSPTQLQQELQAMSGGDAPSIYVDGFSNGSIPPKNTIREIRINQNPFSAQNDTDPSGGQIQILTKPGTDKLHGDFFLFANDSGLNTQNPFTHGQPAYYSTQFNGDIDGPLSKNASYIFDFSHNSYQSNSVINAEVLDPTNATQIAFTQALPTPSTSSSYSPRIDLQLGAKSTLTLRYGFNTNRQTNGGIGQFNLPSQGFDSASTSQSFRASNSQVVSSGIVNDTRFQYIRTRTSQTPYSTAPTLIVQGAFTGGGSNGGASHDNQDSYELQNYLSIQAGKHYLSPGIRLRANRDANVSRSGYNGQFLFSTLAAYQITQQGIANGLTSAQIAAAGGGPSQFSLTSGNPAAAATVVDLGAFFQDDWKVSPNFTFSYGLRYEVQNHISDLGDFAPRLGFAWSLGVRKDKPARFVLRGGSGVFYNRLGIGPVLQAQRQNGVSQQQYVVASPAFYPTIPTGPSTLGPQSSPTIYRISPTFRSQYSIMSRASVDYPLGSRGTLSLQYFNNRVVHALITRNVNAPLPGTYNPAIPTSGTRPFGGTQNIDEYESVGLQESNRLSTNLQFRARNGFSVYTFYQYRQRKSDTNGFPSNGYNIGADYGRGAQDIRHTLFAYLSAPLLPGRIGFGASLEANSGAPFNITVAQDLNGDSQFNDRPAFATDLTRPSVVLTRLGAFDTSPIPGQTIIPINYGQGPGLFSLNAQIYRDFTFGPALPSEPNAPKDPNAPKPAATPAKPNAKPYVDRKYNLTFVVEAANIPNRVNLAPPVGTLGSPFFGQSLSLNGDSGAINANRVINVMLFTRF